MESYLKFVYFVAPLCIPLIVGIQSTELPNTDGWLRERKKSFVGASSVYDMIMSYTRGILLHAHLLFLRFVDGLWEIMPGFDTPEARHGHKFEPLVDNNAKKIFADNYPCEMEVKGGSIYFAKLYNYMLDEELVVHATPDGIGYDKDGNIVCIFEYKSPVYVPYDAQSDAGHSCIHRDGRPVILIKHMFQIIWQIMCTGCISVNEGKHARYATMCMPYLSEHKERAVTFLEIFIPDAVFEKLTQQMIYGVLRHHCLYTKGIEAKMNGFENAYEFGKFDPIDFDFSEIVFNVRSWEYEIPPIWDLLVEWYPLALEETKEIYHSMKSIDCNEQEFIDRRLWCDFDFMAKTLNVDPDDLLVFYYSCMNF